jgi:hypothetical protein
MTQSILPQEFLNINAYNANFNGGTANISTSG